MSCACRQPEGRCAQDYCCCRSVNAEPGQRLQFHEITPDSLDDAPAAGSSPYCHGCSTCQLHPERYFKRGYQTVTEQCHGNDTHGLLRIGCAVGEGHETGGKNLHPAKILVHTVGRPVFDNVCKNYHKEKPD